MLYELGKRDKMRGLPSLLSLFRNGFNKSTNARFYLSYDIKITLKTHFCCKNIIILALSTQRCYGRSNVSRKSVMHLGDNCIPMFHLGRYIVGYTVGNLVLRRRYTSPDKKKLNMVIPILMHFNSFL